ncbi:hypothetical protein Peur_005986 [Populus x canadensis]
MCFSGRKTDLLVEKDPIQHPKDNDGEEVASSGCKRGDLTVCSSIPTGPGRARRRSYFFHHHLNKHALELGQYCTMRDPMDPMRQHTEKWKYLSKGINQYLHNRNTSGFLTLILLKEVAELPAFRYAGENCSQNEKKIVEGELLTRILWQLRLGLRHQGDPAGLGSTETRPMIWRSAFHGLDFPLHYTKAQEAICLDQLLSQAHCLSTTNTKCYQFRKGFFGVSVDMTSHPYTMKSGISG